MMRLIVLGPVGVMRGDEMVPIGRAQRRAILAYLALHVGRTVSFDQLVDALWAGQPPETAKAQIHTAVSAVRRALRAVGADPITTQGSGYRLAVDPDQVDLSIFTEAVATAQARIGEGHREEAALLLRSALDLWQGEPLAGITAAFVEPVRDQLRERHLAAIELLADLELDLGRHQETVHELAALVLAHPLREKLTGQLMVALVRCGRPAEALATYRRLRTALADELGVDPTPELQQLHHRILNNDPQVMTPPGGGVRATPLRLLPADIPDFTGQLDHLSELDKLATRAASVPATVIISAISGTGGVGKTALAVHWAYRAADRFPDGQLHVNLRGYDPHAPLTAVDALRQLLRALGTPPERIPDDQDDAVSLYRHTVADKRLLIVLDNARSVDQVRPLLPSGAGCMALITSRDRLAGLVAREGAHRLTLDALAPDEAFELLGRILDERVAAEPQAVAELAALCDHLPLALRIAACNINDRPEQGIADQVREIAADRLSQLAVEGDGDSSMRVILDRSYQHLSVLDRRVFRLLGTLPVVDFTAFAVAATTDLSVADCVASLERLAAGHLITEPAAGRFGLHDLLRAFAADLVDQQDGMDERDGAVRRFLTWLLSHADIAGPLALRQPAILDPVDAPPPEFDTVDGAMAWLDAERTNLVTATEFAAHRGFPDYAWRLAYSIRQYFHIRRGRTELMAVAIAADSAAEQVTDERARAVAELTMAMAMHLVDRNREALVHSHRSLAIAEALGWWKLSGMIFKGLHLYYIQLGEMRNASEVAQRSLELEARNGTVAPQDYGRIALVDMMRGALHSAASNFEHTLRLSLDGPLVIAAITRLNLGEVYRMLGRYAEAEAQLCLVIDQAAQLDNQHITGVALSNLAGVYRDTGRLGEALDRSAEAIGFLEPVNDEMALIYARHAHATVLMALGRLDEAVEELTATMLVSRRLEALHALTEVLLALADAHRLRGDSSQSRAYAEEARDLAERGEFDVLEAQALDILAALHRQEGHTELAARLAEEVQRMCDKTGHVPFNRL